MKDTRSAFQLYSAAAKRLFMLNFLSRKLDLILITEFPKSGATWFCKMFSDITGIPFPRNVSPRLQQNIMHGHYLFHPRMNKAICFMRDGRDVMVSAYFHFLFFGNDKSPRTTKLHRAKVPFNDYEQVIKNMPAFIDYMFTDFASKNWLHFSWVESVNNALKYEQQVCIIKYEELLDKPTECLLQTLKFYGHKCPSPDELKEIVEKYSFKNMAKRMPGTENRKSFIRKGISGDWKNYFNEEACEVFKKYGGEALIRAGYEKDILWGSSLHNKSEKQETTT